MGLGKTKPGSGVTTRHLVAPKSGLVGMKSGEQDNRMRLNLPEGFEDKTLQPVSF